MWRAETGSQSETKPELLLGKIGINGKNSEVLAKSGSQFVSITCKYLTRRSKKAFLPEFALSLVMIVSKSQVRVVFLCSKYWAITVDSSFQTLRSVFAPTNWNHFPFPTHCQILLLSVEKSFRKENIQFRSRSFLYCSWFWPWRKESSTESLMSFNIYMSGVSPR